MSDKCGSGAHTHACSALTNAGCKNGFPITMGCMPVHLRGPKGQEQWWYAGGIKPHCLDEDYVSDPLNSITL